MTSTDPARWRRLDAILDELLALPVAERAARLAEITGDDHALRAEVEDLLRRDETADALLDGVAVERFDVLLAAAAQSGAEPADLAGTQIGPFRILGRLGEGGMGVVFEARQAHPDRIVALKVLRAGAFAGDRQLRMFRREAESLGRLNHPGIAAIHDAGRTDDGLHWFAMERVDGVTLADWAASRPAPTTRVEIAARIAVFLAVCDAISHAHQRGVVHLDLKPSNLMVLPERDPGAAPAVKVLDFGIARFTGSEAAMSTMGNQGSAFLGTLAYMSPEQADGDVRDLDVRSDVYSLGVVIYELLTGLLPVDIRGLPLAEAVRQVRERNPARPAETCRLLDGDLETIVLKALSKDPPQRYQSVAALAEDIRRWRDDLPIFGRPPSTAYQLRKIVARHRTVIVFAAALVVALLGAVGGTTYGLVKARRAQAEAQAEAEVAAETARFLESVFHVADPSSGRGAEVTARELLENAAAGIDTALVDQPRIRGRLLSTMGTAYRQLGLYSEARPLLEEAVALERQVLGPDDPRVARSHYSLAGLLRRLGEFDAARGHYEAALVIRERLGEPGDLAASITGLANLEVDQNRLAEAAALYKRAMAVTSAGGAPDSVRLASQMSGLSLVQWRLGEADSACATMERVVSIQRSKLGDDDLDLAWSLSALGSFYAAGNINDRARALGEEALAVQERALGPEHTDVAETLDLLANLYRTDGNYEQALALHERALAIWEKAVGVDHATYGMALDHVARDLGSVGRLAEAITAAERAGGIFERTLDPGHRGIMINKVHLAVVYRDAGQTRRARPLLEAMLAHAEERYGPESREMTEIITEMARLDAAEARWDAARSHYRRIAELSAAFPDSGHVLPRLRDEVREMEERRAGS
ncbi:MAG: serine/threonine protein kinase [bacterium]|nr:serine/threonine protein kinase [bacterium]